jgi:hypothetical protein
MFKEVLDEDTGEMFSTTVEESPIRRELRK